MDVAHHFSLCEGGPLYRLTHRSRALGGHDFLTMGIVTSLVAWVPLYVLSALEGRLTEGVTIPFLNAVATHVRLLVAVPMFFMAEAAFNKRARQVIEEIAGDFIPPERRPRFDATLATAARLRDSWLFEPGIALLALSLVGAGGVQSDLPAGVTSWRMPAPDATSLAGWWFLFVSLPISRFLLWRWGLRLLIWWWLLWRLKSLDVKIVPTHPDLAGGLGGLGVAHLALWPFAFGASAIVASAFAEQVLWAGAEIQQFATPLAGFILAICALLTAPLVIFTPTLFDVKQRGLLEYGALANRYVRAFDRKWLRGGAPPDEPLLGSADVQSLADLHNSFHIVDDMRVVPISASQLLSLVAAAVIPALPLIFFVIPLNELILRGFQALIKV